MISVTSLQTTTTTTIITITTTTNNVKKIVWNQCNDSNLQEIQAECGFVSVPLDYNDPNGEQIQIALSRVKHNVSSDKYQGVILLNPGGPGGSGLPYAFVGSLFDANVSSTYDWIGFDPRGVGASIPRISCDPTYFVGDYPGFVPINQTLEDYGYNYTKNYALACGKKYPKLLQHLTTVHVAKDMDMIRIALEQEQINFYGFSYGSYLGQVYATLFPTRLRRMILDSNLDPKNIWFSAGINQHVGFDRNLKLWFNWLAEYDSVFNLGKTGCEVAKKYNNAKKELETNPINGTIKPADWDDIFLSVAYYRDGWIYYGTMLSAWINENNFDLLFEEYQNIISADSENSFAILSAVVCTDAPWPKDWNYVRTEYWRSYGLAPYSAWPSGWALSTCQEWTVNGTTAIVINSTNIGDILLVGATLDAATPIEDSYAVRRLFPNARLVTIINETTHASNVPTNTCMRNIVNQYLKSGELVTRKTGNVADYECLAAPAPDPTISTRSLATNNMFNNKERRRIHCF